MLTVYQNYVLKRVRKKEREKNCFQKRSNLISSLTKIKNNVMFSKVFNDTFQMFFLKIIFDCAFR